MLRRAATLSETAGTRWRVQWRYRRHETGDQPVPAFRNQEGIPGQDTNVPSSLEPGEADNQ